MKPNLSIHKFTIHELWWTSSIFITTDMNSKWPPQGSQQRINKNTIFIEVSNCSDELFSSIILIFSFFLPVPKLKQEKKSPSINIYPEIFCSKEKFTSIFCKLLWLKLDSVSTAIFWFICACVSVEMSDFACWEMRRDLQIQRKEKKKKHYYYFFFNSL